MYNNTIHPGAPPHKWQRESLDQSVNLGPQKCPPFDTQSHSPLQYVPCGFVLTYILGKLWAAPVQLTFLFCVLKNHPQMLPHHPLTTNIHLKLRFDPTTIFVD